MVFNRKRKDNRSPSFILDDSPKRTKVQAQRKFAQGSNVNSPVLTPVKEIECQEKIIPEPIELLPMKRPNTDDFLTFLCFRGTPVLPQNLNFFNNASMVDTRPQSCESPSTSPKNGIIFPTAISKCQGERPFIAFGVRKRADPIVVSRHMDKKRRHALALQALRRKYQEQKMAKIRAITISKLSEKVQTNKTVVRTTRSVTKSDHTIGKKNMGQKTKITVVSTKRVKVTTRRTSTLKSSVRSKTNKQKMCLRSYRGRFVQRELVNNPAKKRTVNKSSKGDDGEGDDYAGDGSMEEEFSSDDDEPLLKKVDKKTSKKVIKKTSVGVKKSSEITYRLTRSNQILARRHPTQSRIIVRTQSSAKTPPNSPRLRSQIKRKLKVVKQEVKSMPMKKHLIAKTVDMKRKVLRGGRIREIEKRSCIKANEVSKIVPARSKRNENDQEEKKEIDEKRITRDTQKKKTEEPKTVKDKSKKHEEVAKVEEKKITKVEVKVAKAMRNMETDEPAVEKNIKESKQNVTLTKKIAKKTTNPKKSVCADELDTNNKSLKKKTKSPDEDSTKKNTIVKNKPVKIIEENKKNIKKAIDKEDEEQEEETSLQRSRFPRKSKEEAKNKTESSASSLKNNEISEDEGMEKKPIKSVEETKTVKKTDSKITDEDPKIIKKNSKMNKKNTDEGTKMNKKTIEQNEIVNKKNTEEGATINKKNGEEGTKVSKRVTEMCDKIIKKKSDDTKISKKNTEEVVKIHKKNSEVGKKSINQDGKINKKKTEEDTKITEDGAKISKKNIEKDKISKDIIQQKNKMNKNENVKKIEKPLDKKKSKEESKNFKENDDDVKILHESRNSSRLEEKSKISGKNIRDFNNDIDDESINEERKISGRNNKEPNVSEKNNKELKISVKNDKESKIPKRNIEVKVPDEPNEQSKIRRRSNRECKNRIELKIDSKANDTSDEEIDDDEENLTEKNKIDKLSGNTKKSTKLVREEIMKSGRVLREGLKKSSEVSEHVKVSERISEGTRKSARVCAEIDKSTRINEDTKITNKTIEAGDTSDEEINDNNDEENTTSNANEKNKIDKLSGNMKKSTKMVREETKKSLRALREEPKISGEVGEDIKLPEGMRKSARVICARINEEIKITDKPKKRDDTSDEEISGNNSEKNKIDQINESTKKSTKLVREDLKKSGRAIREGSKVSSEVIEEIKVFDKVSEGTRKSARVVHAEMDKFSKTNEEAKITDNLIEESKLSGKTSKEAKKTTKVICEEIKLSSEDLKKTRKTNVEQMKNSDRQNSEKAEAKEIKTNDEANTYVTREETKNSTKVGRDQMKTSDKTSEQTQISDVMSEEIRVSDRIREKIKKSNRLDRDGQKVTTRISEDTKEEIKKSSASNHEHIEKSNKITEENKITKEVKSSDEASEGIKKSIRTYRDQSIEDSNVSTGMRKEMKMSDSEQVRNDEVKKDTMTDKKIKEINISNKCIKEKQIVVEVMKKCDGKIVDEIKVSGKIDEEIKSSKKINTCNEELQISDTFIAQEIKAIDKIPVEKKIFSSITSFEGSNKINKFKKYGKVHQLSNEEMENSKQANEEYNEESNASNIENLDDTTSVVMTHKINDDVKISVELIKEEKSSKEILEDLMKISEELKNVGTIIEKTSNENCEDLKKNIKGNKSKICDKAKVCSRTSEENEGGMETGSKFRKEERMKDNEIEKDDLIIIEDRRCDLNLTKVSEEYLKATRELNDLNSVDINVTKDALKIVSEDMNENANQGSNYFNTFLFKDLSVDQIDDVRKPIVEQTNRDDELMTNTQFEESRKLKWRKAESIMKTYINRRLKKTKITEESNKCNGFNRIDIINTCGISEFKDCNVVNIKSGDITRRTKEESDDTDSNDNNDINAKKYDDKGEGINLNKALNTCVAAEWNTKIFDDTLRTNEEDLSANSKLVTNFDEGEITALKEVFVATTSNKNVIINLNQDDARNISICETIKEIDCVNIDKRANYDMKAKKGDVTSLDMDNILKTNNDDAININSSDVANANFKRDDVSSYEHLMNTRNNLQLEEASINQEDILKKAHGVNFLTDTKKYYDIHDVEPTIGNDSEDDGTDSDEDTALRICENASDSDEDVPLKNYETFNARRALEKDVQEDERVAPVVEETVKTNSSDVNNKNCALDTQRNLTGDEIEKNLDIHLKNNFEESSNLIHERKDFAAGRRGVIMVGMQIEGSTEKCDGDNILVFNDERWKSYETTKNADEITLNKGIEGEEEGEDVDMCSTNTDLNDYDLHLKKNATDEIKECEEDPKANFSFNNQNCEMRLKSGIGITGEDIIKQPVYTNLSSDNEECFKISLTGNEIMKKTYDLIDEGGNMLKTDDRNVSKKKEDNLSFTTEHPNVQSNKMVDEMVMNNITKQRIEHQDEVIIKKIQEHIIINENEATEIRTEAEEHMRDEKLDEIMKKCTKAALDRNIAVNEGKKSNNDLLNHAVSIGTGTKSDADDGLMKKISISTSSGSYFVARQNKGDIALSKYPDDDILLMEHTYFPTAGALKNYDISGQDLLENQSKIDVIKISDRSVEMKKNSTPTVISNSSEDISTDDTLKRKSLITIVQDTSKKKINAAGDGCLVISNNDDGNKSEDCGVEVKRPKFDETTSTNQISPENLQLKAMNEIDATKHIQDIITKIARELAEQDAQFKPSPKQLEVKKKNVKKPSILKKGVKPVETKKSPKQNQRPTRKTKEAAAVYMEILGHKLGTENADDDDVSIDSFPELPNVKKTEQRENELKAKAIKENPSEEPKAKPVKKRERKLPKTGAKPLRNFTSDSDESYTAEIKTPPEKRLRQTRNISPKLYKSFSDTDTESDLIPIKQAVVKRKSDTLSGEDKGKKKKAKLVEEEEEEEESFDESDEEPLVKLKLKKMPEEGKQKRECTKKPQNYLPLFSSSDDEEKYFHGFVKCESPPKPKVMKIEPPIDLLSTKDVGRRYGKEKVNMSNEQIEKWLNDSALAGMSVIRKENDEMLKFGEKIPTETSLENLADINTDGLKSSLLKPVLKDKTVCSTSTTPEKYVAAMRPFSNERKTIFRKEKSEPSRNVNAFSVCNESSVYAFEADNEDSISTPFRRPNRRPSSTATSRSEDDAEQKITGKFRHPNVIRADCSKSGVKDVSLNISTDESNNSGSVAVQKTVLNTTTKLPPEKLNKPLAASTPMCPPTQTTLQKTKLENRSARSCSKSLDRVSDASEEFKYKVPSSPSASSSSSAKLYKRNAKSRPKGPENYRPINVTEFPTQSQTARIVEAPVFHPNEKEFIDPIEYIEKIRGRAQKFGICRIVPPPNFKPECKVLDEMRFTAYNQYVHKMMHRWGPNFRELVAIRKYLATQSISLKHPPWIGGMEIDLPRLYQTVQTLGGLKEVIEKKKWSKVSELMKIPKSAQDRVTKLDDIYCKYLLPYDTLSPDERDKLFDSVETEWAKRESKNLLKVQQNADEERKSEEEEMESEDEEESDIECIVKGRNMALNTFYRIARNSMATWFKNPEPNAQEVEEEFWKHVTTKKYHICVHSGSIDSGNWGYGFAVSKNSPFARHAWNLKVLTNNSGSILRSMGPVMGLTVPTLHVGMVFSGCCWYRDPHGLPWIEYLHTGANKIWYGIPDTMSEKFHSTLLNIVPNYCLNKSIWLPSDTVMLPPELLVDSGVSLTRTVQQPGQFVVIFPKAFTSNICTGYVVSESVFFAPPHWLESAEYVFEELRNSCEPSMFSYERLLLSIANDSRSDVNVLKQIVPAVGKLCLREKKQREELKTLGVTNEERLPVPDNKKKKKMHECETEYACEDCRWNLFCSMVFDSQDNGIYCLEHAIKHLQMKILDSSKCRLMYTYDVAELDVLVKNMDIAIEMKLQKKNNSRYYSLPTMVNL